MTRLLPLLLIACTASPVPGDGLSATRISPRETGRPDTAAPDTADTAPVDSAPVDTSRDTAAHTGLIDSGNTDSAADTAPVDTGLDPADMAPDFALVDQNPNSPRYGEVVSPRDYLEQVSGWYFTHAT